MNKYEPLTAFLRNYPGDRVTLSFQTIEETIGSTLPPSSYNHEAHWRSGARGRPGAAIAEAGWQVETMSQFGQTVTLVRLPRRHP